jgi:RNA recognition motif-containing protein
VSNKLYVGGLSYLVTEGQLQEIFAAHGTVASVRMIADKSTGHSRGFAFVEMSSEAEARKAMEAVNGIRLEGRTLAVNDAYANAWWSRKQERRP